MRKITEDDRTLHKSHLGNNANIASDSIGHFNKTTTITKLFYITKEKENQTKSNKQKTPPQKIIYIR